MCAYFVSPSRMDVLSLALSLYHSLLLDGPLASSSLVSCQRLSLRSAATPEGGYASGLRARHSAPGCRRAGGPRGRRSGTNVEEQPQHGCLAWATQFPQLSSARALQAPLTTLSFEKLREIAAADPAVTMASIATAANGLLDHAARAAAGCIDALIDAGSGSALLGVPPCSGDKRSFHGDFVRLGASGHAETWATPAVQVAFGWSAEGTPALATPAPAPTLAPQAPTCTDDGAGIIIEATPSAAAGTCPTSGLAKSRRRPSSAALFV